MFINTSKLLSFSLKLPVTKKNYLNNMEGSPDMMEYLQSLEGIEIKIFFPSRLYYPSY